MNNTETKHFNGLSPAEAERIAMLMEEAAEIIQMCGKILRHGYESHNPTARIDGSNRRQLARELDDLEAVLSMMTDAGDFSGIPRRSLQSVVEKKLLYTHHQRVTQDE